MNSLSVESLTLATPDAYMSIRLTERERWLYMNSLEAIEGLTSELELQTRDLAYCKEQASGGKTSIIRERYLGYIESYINVIESNQQSLDKARRDASKFECKMRNPV